MDLTFRRTAQSPLSVRSIGSDQFWGSNFLNFNTCGVFFQKNEYFWGKDEFVDVLWGSSKHWVFKVQNGNIYLFIYFFFFFGVGGLLIFQIFLGVCLICSIYFLGVNSRCCVQAGLRLNQKWEYPMGVMYIEISTWFVEVDISYEWIY